MRSITIAYIVCGELITLTQTYDLALLIAEITEPYNQHYGAGNWVCLDAASLPADFSVDTYTIENGQLVPAPAELLAERLAARRVADREAIRAERERRYQSEAIASLYWTWIESGVEADRTAWIAAKEAVRLELPYPQAQEGGVQ